MEQETAAIAAANLDLDASVATGIETFIFYVFFRFAFSLTLHTFFKKTDLLAVGASKLQAAKPPVPLVEWWDEALLSADKIDGAKAALAKEDASNDDKILADALDKEVRTQLYIRILFK